MPYLHHLVQFGEALIFVQNQSANGHILVAFGQVEVKLIVHLVNLEAGREHILVIGYLFGNIVRAVVLVFNIAKYLFNNILERDDATGATKLVDHYAQDFLLLQEDVHKLLRHHGFGHKGHGVDVVFPSVGVAEHL